MYSSKLFIVVSILSVTLIGSTYAQEQENAQEEVQEQTPTPPKPQEESQESQESQEETQTQSTKYSTEHIFIIFTDSKPDQVIVLDDNGIWMPDVKSIKIEMEIGQQPTCSCVMWSGYYKPSNPFKQTWSLKQARSVDPEKFQSMIDDLQKDPSAISN